MAESEELLPLLYEEDETLGSETHVKIGIEHSEITDQSSVTHPDTTLYDLAEGKKFHLFISHSNVDYEQVKFLVNKFEKEYSIRCMMAERDFVGGVPIEVNITARIEESMKILIVFTPNYLESGWCEYEQRIGFAASIKKRKNCIIPLMLEPCDIPNSLKDLTYIDARHETDIPAKIMEAFYSNASLSDFAPDLIAQMKVDQQELLTSLLQKQNGRTLLQLYAKQVKDKCSELNRMEFQLTPEDENALIQDEDYAIEGLYDIIEELNSSLYMQNYDRCYGRRNCLFLTNLAFVLAFFVWMAISVMVILGMKSYDKQIYLWNILCLTLILLAICITPCIRCCVRVQMLATRKVCVFKHVQRFYKDSKFLVYLGKGPMLQIVRYDTDPCKKYLKEMMLRLDFELTDAEVEREVDFWIEESIFKYETEICTSTLPYSPINRHNTYNNRKCLCQVIEPSIRVNRRLIV